MSMLRTNKDPNIIHCDFCDLWSTVGMSKDIALAAYLRHVLKDHYGLNPESDRQEKAEPPKTTKLHYGDNKTWHGTQLLNVETKNGKVVSVWFRCMALPFDQTEVGEDRAVEMEHVSKRINQHYKLHAVDVEMEDWKEDGQ